jgi:lysophospholipase L1-like esterase
MKWNSFLLLFLLSLQASAQKKIKIACIGNSITYGYSIPEREKNSYPAQLQALLGSGYEVTNYGLNGTTLLSKGNNPYRNNKEYKEVLDSKPDVIFIKLGTNDSKVGNRIYLNELEKDYQDFLKPFLHLSSHPRIVLLLPVPSLSNDTTFIWNPPIINEIIPHIRQVAYKEHLEVIDIYSLLIDQPQMFPDKVHPNKDGATVIARRLYELLKAKRDTSYDIFRKINFPKKYSSFHGYACADFTMNNRNCKIVKPKWTAPNHPWVWRSRIWGHEPQTDIALLERGYHIVYCDVVELFMNSEAINLWSRFYSMVRKAGLAKKAVMEGMSRGGVYCYNWAAVNPDKVACVYVDNPVLDLKSWPGGKGIGPGSKNEWEMFKKDFGYKSDGEAMSFHGSPVDKVAQIVRGKYPMLHVCGDDDEIVPMIENTIPFEAKVKALGGNITVIHKLGFKHHPHSLPNPTPIVDFIVKAVRENR